MAYDEIYEKSKTSADNTSAVVLSVPSQYTEHCVLVTVTGSPSTGTLTVSDENGQDFSTTIDLTALAPYKIAGFSSESFTFTPATFDGTNFTVKIRSWKTGQH